MSDDDSRLLRYTPFVTLCLFALFIVACVVCVIPNLFFIEFNTSDIEDNTSALTVGGHVSNLLVQADADIQLLHEDMKVLHDLLGAAADLLVQIRDNTAK